MRSAHVIMGAGAVLICGCRTEPSLPTSQATNVTMLTPLILEKNEGEFRLAVIVAPAAEAFPAIC